MFLFGCCNKSKLPTSGTCGENLTWEYDSAEDVYLAPDREGE